MLCSLSVGNILLFVIRVLSRVLIVVELSILLMDSNIIWWILAEFMTEFGFSGRISRVHFVVNLLLATMAMVTCSIRREYSLCFCHCQWSC